MIATPRFFIRQGQWGITTELKFGIDYGENGIAIAEPAVMKHFKKEEITCELPSLISLPASEAGAVLQNLMDELWSYGIRPKDIGTAGHLAATQEHLKDMRALVSKTLDVKL